MIAILGSGMSALFAAWACIEEGEPFEIFTNDASVPVVAGFQYLASPCNLPVASTTLHRSVTPVVQSVITVTEQYNMKVYGIPDLSSELGHFQDEEQIWSMKEARDVLWPMVQDNIHMHNFRSLDQIKKLKDMYMYVFSTIPLNKLGVGGLQYTLADVALFAGTEKSFCVYNTDSHIQWYRSGSVFGHGFMESLHQEGIPVGVHSVIKVIGKDAVLVLPRNVMLCGRYGAWDRTVRVDDVYYQVKECLRR